MPMATLLEGLRILLCYHEWFLLLLALRSPAVPLHLHSVPAHAPYHL